MTNSSDVDKVSVFCLTFEKMISGPSYHFFLLHLARSSETEKFRSLQKAQLLLYKSQEAAEYGGEDAVSFELFQLMLYDGYWIKYKQCQRRRRLLPDSHQETGNHVRNYIFTMRLPHRADAC